MYIRIKKTAAAYCFGNSEETRDIKKFLEDNAGKLVEVETDHLFNNQYNTDHFRIMDSQIEEVVNDARINKGKCKYCGRLIERSEIVCYHSAECWNYGVEWFTPENTFFLKYPAGMPKNEVQLSYTYDKPFKVGSYDLYQDTINVETLFVLKNARQTIRFKYQDQNFFIYDSTFGFKQVKKLDIVLTAETKLMKFLTSLKIGSINN